jgi:hypothetical protein
MEVSFGFILLALSLDVFSGCVYGYPCPPPVQALDFMVIYVPHQFKLWILWFSEMKRRS